MAGSGGAFRLESVSCERGGRVVLSAVDLEVAEGRITALIGPSGSGKTSLLRLLDRLDDPTSGTISYGGRPLPAYPVTQLRREVAFVFQTPVLFPGTVRDNLAEAARIGKIPTPEVDERAREVAALAELDIALLERDGRELSVGQQQRAALARALVNRPGALLLDEPTASLDAETAERLLRTIRRLVRDEGLTVVLATHRLEEARAVADFTVRLRDGRVVEAESTGGIRVETDAVPPAAGEG